MFSCVLVSVLNVAHTIDVFLLHGCGVAVKCPSALGWAKERFSSWKHDSLPTAVALQMSSGIY